MITTSKNLKKEKKTSFYPFLQLLIQHSQKLYQREAWCPQL